MKSLISLPFLLDTFSKSIAIQEIIKTNELSERYGLLLTRNDAIELIETRDIALHSTGRIEIGSGTIGKMIATFCSSSFILQENYARIIHDLLEAFYYIKNETLDLISDDELIILMRDYFEKRCQGSLELLLNRELEQLARNLRFGIDDYSNLDEKSDDHDDEEEMF